ncbi:hypothetical protein ISN45_Aa04g020540 [Arabidopsis thaliana x Arabidopsis arenosa]|uniref:Uncharacterized protein n=1 Tax=Arabidopsis thaliana x Arabidopsis arenosa TaxID=1240361 RepID=A0A8T2ACE5_9BRAS|nr:hypothetical protein ISN45_Aa04g020540 [Arabidopsis thaliana x Arabidopsis arenosa]
MAGNHQSRLDLEEMGFRSRSRSHLFLNEFETSVGGFYSLSRNHRDDPYVSDVVDTLSDQFSSMSLLRPKPRPVPALPSSLQSSSRLNGVKAEHRLYRERLKREPFYELHLSRIRKNESQQDRAKVLQTKEARLQKRGLVHRNGNVLKESVGTGVFHPLQRPTFKTFDSVKKHNQRNRNQSEKELLTKEKRGVMTTTTQEQQQKEECHYHLPSDMDFSKDWTF